MFLATNLKWLRQRKKRTQEEVAFALEMKRVTYGGYENGVGEPGITKLLAMSGYYRISLDTIIKIDLRKVSEAEWQRLVGQEKWPLVSTAFNTT